MKNLNKALSLFLTLVMLFTINPLKSNAKWDDRSDELPGMTSDGTIIALAAVAAVGVGVLVYVLVKKNKQDKATGAMEGYKTMETIMWENQIIKLAKEKENAAVTSQSV